MHKSFGFARRPGFTQLINLGNPINKILQSGFRDYIDAFEFRDKNNRNSKSIR
jgi:hypothetical protein